MPGLPTALDHFYYISFKSCKLGGLGRVGINPTLSDPLTPRTSKLGWRYFEANKIDRNELQILKIVQFFSHFCSCAFLSISANLEFIPINFIGFKVPPAQF